MLPCYYVNTFKPEVNICNAEQQLHSYLYTIILKDEQNKYIIKYTLIENVWPLQ